MKPLLIVGSYLSPYVRKVLVCLEIKGIPYQVDHIVPFFGDDRFSKLSPLRRIPVLVDGDLVLTDSSVICEYLEDLKPAPAVFPADIRDRARARWLDEFADTRMGDVFIWRYFNQIAIRPSVWGEKGDIPVPHDYEGVGHLQIAVWRPSTGEWWIQGHGPIQWGQQRDAPVPGRYTKIGAAALGQPLAPINAGEPTDSGGPVPNPSRMSDSPPLLVAVLVWAIVERFLDAIAGVFWGR